MLKLIDVSLRRDEPYFRQVCWKFGQRHRAHGPNISNDSVAQFKILL